MALPAMTRGELATLGIYVDARGAIVTTKQLAGELDALGKKGAAVAGIAGGSVAPAMDRVQGATARARLSVGRLGNQFGSLIASMSGVHPVATNIVGVLGNFAVGGAVMAGILGGLAAITFAYKKLTEDARDAARATRELIADLREWASLQGPQGDPMQQALDITRSQESRLLGQVRSPQFADLPEHFQNDLRTKLAQAIKDRMAAEDRLRQRESADQRDRNTRSFEMSRQLPQKGGRGFDPSKRIDLVGFDVDTRLRGAGGMPISNEEWLRQRISGAATAPFQMKPMAPMQSGLELRAASNIPVKLDSIGQRLRDGLKSVSGELLAGLTNVAMSMAMIGGSGKGSQLGGFIAGTIGGGIGSAFGGPIGAAVGTVVGTMAGSLFGGLFDKKKKVASGLDMMATQLARVNQQLRNMPSGYKIARGQHNATFVGMDPDSGRPPGPGAGPGLPGPGSPGGGGVVIQNMVVRANSPTDFVREMERAVASAGTRGGPMRVPRAA